MIATTEPSALGPERLRELVVRSLPGAPRDARIRRRPLSLVSTSSVLYRVEVRSPDDAAEVGRCVLKLARRADPRHRREVAFYRDSSARVAGLVPRCYAAGEGHLLLEDCSPGRTQQPMDTCPLPAVRELIRCLARLHAGLWARRHGPEPREAEAGALELFAGWRGHLAARDLDLLRRAAGEQDALRSRLSPARTLCHGDFHPLNVLTGAAGPIALDWQDAHPGSPAEDLAVFLAAYVHPLDRRRFEARWLGDYHGELARRGVTYALDDLRRDYRTAVALALLRPVRLSRVGGLRPEAVLLRAKHLLTAAEEVLDDAFWASFS